MEIKTKYFIFGSQDFRQAAGLHVAEHLACGRVRLKGPMQSTEDGFVLPQRMEVVSPVGNDHFFQAPIGISWGYHIWTFLDTSVLWPFQMWQIKVAGGKCGVTPCWYVVCVAVLRTTRGKIVVKLVDQHFKHINSCSKNTLLGVLPTLTHYSDIFWHSYIVSNIPFGRIYGISFLTFYLTYFLAYILTFFLAVFLAFYLASILTFYLASFYAFILAVYLASILTFYLASVLTFYLASILTFFLAFFLAYILTFPHILSGILTFSLACVRVQAWPTASRARYMRDMAQVHWRSCSSVKI